MDGLILFNPPLMARGLEARAPVDEIGFFRDQGVSCASTPAKTTNSEIAHPVLSLD
jgi:hypothetical protein